MSLRTVESMAPVPRAFDAGRFGRVTWLGLFVATIGWALLLATMVPGRLPAALHGDLVEVARCLIGSGFALAVIGALQNGFGALNRFFNAALDRSNARAAPAPSPVAPPDVDPSVEPSRQRRPYQILADGSVEVETIVGTRRFDSMAEARDFI